MPNTRRYEPRKVNKRKRDELSKGPPSLREKSYVFESKDEDRRDEEEVFHEAHRLPGSMSSSARRLRQEPFDESSARIFAE